MRFIVDFHINTFTACVASAAQYINPYTAAAAGLGNRQRLDSQPHVGPRRLGLGRLGTQEKSQATPFLGSQLQSPEGAAV
jgi:hypothetical protein